MYKGLSNQQGTTRARVFHNEFRIQQTNTAASTKLPSTCTNTRT